MEQQNGLRPFDLEAAKRGEPLVTRDGRKAKFVSFEFYDAGTCNAMRAEVEGDPIAYYRDGRFLRSDEHPMDLFMAPIEKPKDDIPQGCRPFDLEAAKRGEPLVTRDGRPAFFIAHDLGAHERYRLLVRLGSGRCAISLRENGRVSNIDSPADLFMAPKPKRKLWVNVYGWSDGRYFATSYGNEERAKKDATVLAFGQTALAVAIPIEVEDWETGK